jgi:hypothetical protein
MTAKTDLLRGPKDVAVKTRAVARTMTTGTAICKIPKGSRILGITVQGVASDSATAATLSFGTSATATEYVTGHDVKTAATGTGPVWCKQVSGTMGGVLTADTTIYAIYAETGAASVGNWYASVWYTTGNISNDDTI